MGALDFAAIGLYAIAVLAIGVRAGRGHAAAGDWLLAGRSLPSWAAALSLVATELSAATFIGVPHAAYTGDWSYLQLALGALAGKAWLAARVIPLYHARGVVTVYGLLDERFGPRTRRAAALCFVGGRLLASGVRLFIAALAFATVTGWSIEAAIVACGAVAALYTRQGGLRSVVWTDVLQGALLVVAAALAAGGLGLRAEGGWPGIWGWAAEAERTRVLHLDPLWSLADARPLLTAVAGGFFLTLATHATDHDMVQRLLATRDGRAGGRALWGSALANFPLTALFLALGTGLAFFYATSPGYDISDGERIFPLFALHELPAGARGVVFAGLFAAAMSSLDSALCAISATWVVDVRPGPKAERARRLHRVAPIVTALLVGAALAMAAYHRATSAANEAGGFGLVQVALSAMTVLYGGLLGVFGFAVLSKRRVPDGTALAALAVGAAAGIALFLHPVLLGRTWIAWAWWIPIAAAGAVTVLAAGARAR
ncbi:MAG: hypothetical protein QNK03_27825 [Myxococcota bacterium]|nr:hypothetical protein [Myxococcota bacterium]